VKVYLAGPEVFLPDAREQGARKKKICAEHGLEGIFPLDVEPDLAGLAPFDQGVALTRTCVALMRDCDALIANMTPFRGPSCDVGTAVEVGYMAALDRPVHAYSNVAADFESRSRGHDDLSIERFGMTDNLMLDGLVDAAGFRIRVTAAADPLRDLTAFTACVHVLKKRLA
jgi:nucleoside 2-deoxyribosyltransferase